MIRLRVALIITSFYTDSIYMEVIRMVNYTQKSHIQMNKHSYYNCGLGVSWIVLQLSENFEAFTIDVADLVQNCFSNSTLPF